MDPTIARYTFIAVEYSVISLEPRLLPEAEQWHKILETIL